MSARSGLFMARTKLNFVFRIPIMHKAGSAAALPAFLVLLTVSERYSYIMRPRRGANSHENTVLVVRVCGFERLTNVTGIRHAFSRNFENNVAFLDSTIGCGALRIDVGNNDAGFARACD